MNKEKAILLKINGELKAIGAPTAPGDMVQEIYPHDPEALEIYRHSCAHLLAQAVVEMFPGVQYGIGPAVENGFYYDFLMPQPFVESDLEKIASKMAHLAKQNLPIQKEIWSKKQAADYFRSRRQNLKLELLEEKVVGDEVSVFKQGDFVDLCRGPHLPGTGLLKHFKLLSVAAAYWKGDEKSHSLQRVYGTVFADGEALKDHLRLLREAKERDHRLLGKALDLFSLQEEAGPGLVYWHPKGARMRNVIEAYWKQRHYQGGYDLLYTPHIGREWLWQTSGHLDFYKDSMYAPMDIDGLNYYLKPMNCPFHIMVYKSTQRSYRDLPLRWAELGTVYRYERSGTLHGLLRVRGFTQDDAHIICTPEQIDEEILRVLDFSIDLLKAFGFIDFKIELSVRDPQITGKYAGSDAMWLQAEASLVKALTERQLVFQRMEGEAVFYGPKIDIKIKDALGRYWQCTTIQFDFNMSERFDMKYIGADGSAHQPFMVHRALLGSLERFFGVLIEHYKGFFPLWLAPVQIAIAPVSDDCLPYARTVLEQLRQHDLRAELDARAQGVNRKIRDAEVQKIPYIIVIGSQEQQQGNISFRIHKKGDQGKMALNEFITKIKIKIEEKNLNYEIQ
ncbi:MAG: threonine--tRNA ligase [Candidatus Aminicenantes bacterium]|nr:threonine--tRNA ligase [Candidatus Aminicenantes bacterium]